MARKSPRPTAKDERDPADVHAEVLLRRHEVIRDPVQRDIPITALERCLIDTPAFQRLRGLKQLGATHLVYPGAVHTRFDHSLGVLSVAEKLVRIMNENYDRSPDEEKDTGRGFLRRISPYEHLVVRLTALLHDLAQMPFGHTFSREGGLGKEEWDDPMSVSTWLTGPSETSIASSLRKFLGLAKMPVRFADTLIEDVARYLAPADLMKLRAPFIADIVSNTLSADLLDYLERDAYFCGIRAASGDRVLQYLCVMNVRRRDLTLEGKGDLEPSREDDARGRVVLTLYRYQTDHSGIGRSFSVVGKLGLLAEAVDLLRGRLALAEKVYFHRTKAAASAMLISAATSAGFETGDFRYLDDEELLSLLAGERAKDDLAKVQVAAGETATETASIPSRTAESDTRSRRLVSAYRARALYTQVYEQRRPPGDTLDDFEESKQFRSLVDDTRDPEWRRGIEGLLERDVVGLEPGGIAIYCPDNEMNRKEFRVLVHQAQNAEVVSLGVLVDGDPDRRDEMRAIRQGHRRLWALRVFVDRRLELPEQSLADLWTACAEIFGTTRKRRGMSLGRSLGQLIQDKLVRDLGKEYGVSIASEAASEIQAASFRQVGEREYLRAEEVMEKTMRSYLEQQIHAARKPLERSEDDER